MKTTVNIEDRLYRLIKMRAAEEGTTVAALVERGMRMVLDVGRPPATRTALPILPGAGGLRPGVDLSDNAALLDLMEGGLAIEKRR